MNDIHQNGPNEAKRPNILILCIDQWDTHMDLPGDVRFPALERLEAQGVSFDNHYCTIPICTPSRATMWTGLHANLTGAFENTNYGWIEGLSPDVQTIGHMLRQQSYYTAFKGKWHGSWLPHSEDALEPFGFSDYQHEHDCAAAPGLGVPQTPPG